MRKRLLMFASAMLWATASQATPITLTAFLSGPGESPPNSSTGTGYATVILDTTANTLEVDVTFGGLTGTTTASHIHCCIAPSGATGVATTVPTFAGFPLGVTSGAYSNTLNLLDLGSYNPAFVSANGGTAASAEAALAAGLVAGDAYLNIHTTFRTGGEIRGFLDPVPEPATLLLLGTGLFGVGARRWRNRRG